MKNIEPSVATALGVGKGAELNSQAYLKRCAGDFKGAERAYLGAIKIREQGLGKDHHLTAISYNSLGELYMVMGELGTAEEYLDKALAIRATKGLPVDLAITRDNLGRLFEMKGDLKAAADIRRQGGPDNVACSNYGGVSIPPFVISLAIDGYQCINFTNSLAQLSQCGKCEVRTSVARLL